jgi:hypothetical protein
MTRATYVLRNGAYKIRWRLVEHINALDLDGGTPYEVIVRPYKSNRSLEQNNLLHSWLREIAEETGHTVEEIKDYVCSEYLGSREYLGINGTPKRRLVTTSELSVEEMSALIERVAQLGAQLYVEGPIRTRSYDDKSGNKRYVTEIKAYTVQALGQKESSHQEYVPGADEEPLPF